jgi:hypothetical protein
LDAAAGVDVLVLPTEWNQFRALDLSRVRQVMLGNVLVDLRNIYPETLAQEAGFIYTAADRAFAQPAALGDGQGREHPPSVRSDQSCCQHHVLVSSTEMDGASPFRIEISDFERSTGSAAPEIRDAPASQKAATGAVERRQQPIPDQDAAATAPSPTLVA